MRRDRGHAEHVGDECEGVLLQLRSPQLAARQREAEEAQQAAVAAGEIEHAQVACVAEHRPHHLARGRVLLQRDREVLAERGARVAMLAQRVQQHLVARVDARFERRLHGQILRLGKHRAQAARIRAHRRHVGVQRRFVAIRHSGLQDRRKAPARHAPLRRSRGRAKIAPPAARVRRRRSRGRGRRHRLTRPVPAGGILSGGSDPLVDIVPPRDASNESRQAAAGGAECAALPPERPP
ncbi:hypothetical protein [Dokdonella fugitiva]|uniref:hypothetical protein n=1 Tax=Dokdonella fugitiva TaxID=328517 RepID=UPI001045E3B2|nr:hypothetical protein [Dokdonella fugitiva]